MALHVGSVTSRIYIYIYIYTVCGLGEHAYVTCVLAFRVLQHKKKKVKGVGLKIPLSHGNDHAVVIRLQLDAAGPSAICFFFKEHCTNAGRNYSAVSEGDIGGENVVGRVTNGLFFCRSITMMTLR